MSYTVQYDPQAAADLEKLPKNIARRIVSKINWLADNFEQIKPLPLSANWAGYYKLRVGDYRVVYDFDRAIRIITIDRVGHRREIYE